MILFHLRPAQAGGQGRVLVGRRVRQGGYTNFVYLSLGIILGIMIGPLTIPLAGLNLSLGTGGGAFLTGLVFGWL